MVEDLYKSGHVCALKVMGQIYIHIEAGDGVLLIATSVQDPDRMTDIFDTYLVDGNLAGIFAALYVGDLGFAVLRHIMLPQCSAHRRARFPTG